MATTSTAADMTFQGGGNDVRCRECAFIQATGTIAPETPSKFREFLAKNPYSSFRVRLQSPGGNLAAAIELGEIFRKNNIVTEVGSDVIDPSPDSTSSFHDGRTSIRKPGECASACAYAYMGGVERVLEDDSRIGFHRFFRLDAINAPTLPMFTGNDLAEEQRIVSALVLYTLQMGVSAQTAVLAASAGPEEMKWIESQEAAGLRLSYNPRQWLPWHVEVSNDGLYAASETVDSSVSVFAFCTKRAGRIVRLVQKGVDVPGYLQWFEQNRECTMDGVHPVFGAQVPAERVRTFRSSNGGAAVEFELGNQKLDLDTPAIFSKTQVTYASACSTDEYDGTTKNFRASVLMAFRNCMASDDF